MSQRHLGINISESYVEFSVLNKSEVIHTFSSAYTGKSDLDRKDAVRAIMENQSALNEDFANVTLAWCHPQSTLVPASVFSESNPTDIFTLCFGSDAASGTIDHNRIFELSVVNIYAIPDWIKSLFVIKYPHIVLQHAGTHQVRESVGSNAFYTKSSLVIHEDYFRITVAKHNNLEFYSSFSFQSAEDIIYHLNFVLQQKELINDKGSIEISWAAGGQKSICEAVKDGLKDILHLKNMNIELKEAFLTKSQLLCV